MTVPHGVSLALSNGPLDDPVTWTRIDNLAGVSITGITIDRGRPDERSKTSPGQVTIKGIDTAGVFDPTNSSSPLSPHLLPEKQCAITLYNPMTSTWDWLFRGSVQSFNHTFDLAQKWTEFEIDLVDWLQLLNDAEIVPDQAGNAVPFESRGDCYYTGQHCDDRQLAVLQDTATAFEASVWPTNLLEVASGNVFVQGRPYPARTTLLSVIDEAVDAEYPVGTNRFMTKYGAYAFRGRFYRFVPLHYIPADNATRASGTRMLHWFVGDTAANQADSTVCITQGMSFKESDSDLINAALVTPVGISTAQLASNSGNNFQADATSITTYGVRTGGMSFEGLITGDADDHNTFIQETASFTEAIVHNYKDPVTYADRLIFKNPSAGATTAQKTARWKLLQGIELSDLVTLTTTHPGGGGFNVSTGAEQDHFVESLHYEITPLKGDEWMVVLTVGLSSRKHYRYMPSSWKPPVDGSNGLKANFSYAEGTSPTINFTDLSTPGSHGPITAWSWNFGDSNTSTLQNPSHTYASTGNYLVQLTVTGTSPDGTATIYLPVIVI